MSPVPLPLPQSWQAVFTVDSNSFWGPGTRMHPIFNSGPSIRASISTKLLSFYWRYQAELGSLLINALWILLVSPRAKSNSLFFHWWSCLFLFSPWKIQVVFWILPFLPKLTYHPFPSQGRGVSKRQLSAYHSSPSFPNIRIHYHLHVPPTVPNISLKLLWQLQ